MPGEKPFRPYPTLPDAVVRRWRGRHHPAVFRAAITLGCLVLWASALSAMPRREPPLLLGGKVERQRREVPVDPRLPTGVAALAVKRPVGGERLCSFRRPVCVHAADVGTPQALATLESLEWAYERVVWSLRLPEPLPDQGAGGTDALDAYLEDDAAPFAVEPGALRGEPFTQTPAFCRIPVQTPVLLRRAATQCVAEAVALALDSSEPPHVRRAFGTAAWWAVGEPTSLDVQAIDDAQAHPENAIVTSELGPSSEGAALLFAYLEETQSAGSPLELSAALLSASTSSYADVGLTYRNEPDLFDVLRHSLEEDSARFAAMMVDFSVARAFIGSRDDGQHLPELAWSGAFGRVRFDWVVRFSSLPRRVAIQPPVDSTGSVLLWLDLDEVPIGAALAVRAEWEAPVSFQWQLVKLDVIGQEIGRVDVPFQQRGTVAEVRMTQLGGARSVLVVGTNLEGIEVAHPFDPDIAPFEPHGVTIYLARL